MSGGNLLKFGNCLCKDSSTYQLPHSYSGSTLIIFEGWNVDWMYLPSDLALSITKVCYTLLRMPPNPILHLPITFEWATWFLWVRAVTVTPNTFLYFCETPWVETESVHFSHILIIGIKTQAKLQMVSWSKNLWTDLDGLRSDVRQQSWSLIFDSVSWYKCILEQPYPVTGCLLWVKNQQHSGLDQAVPVSYIQMFLPSQSLQEARVFLPAAQHEHKVFLCLWAFISVSHLCVSHMASDLQMKRPSLYAQTAFGSLPGSNGNSENNSRLAGLWTNTEYCTFFLNRQVLNTLMMGGAPKQNWTQQKVFQWETHTCHTPEVMYMMYW